MNKRITDLSELQLRLLYSIIVAGKSAIFANNVMQKWIAENIEDNELPFDCLKRLNKQNELLLSFQKAKTGNYNKIYTAAKEITNTELDLFSCLPEDLEKIKGIGPKTSRFFIMWTRPKEVYAALDIHILRWLRNLGYDVPKSTPQSTKKYKEIEKIFLQEAQKRGKTPRELDAEIWENSSGSVNIIIRKEWHERTQAFV